MGEKTKKTLIGMSELEKRATPLKAKACESLITLFLKKRQTKAGMLLTDIAASFINVVLTRKYFTFWRKDVPF